MRITQEILKSYAKKLGGKIRKEGSKYTYVEGDFEIKSLSPRELFNAMKEHHVIHMRVY